MNLCLSSETYLIDIDDIARLPDSDYAPQYKNDGKIVVLLGDLNGKIPDTLLCGRELLQQAAERREKSVPVEFAFFDKTRWFDFITPFFKKLRRKYKIWSYNIYHMDPREIRRMKIERSFRDRNTAYTFSNPLYRCSDEERKNRYQALYDSMSKGYDDNCPIEIMLLRLVGIKDTVNNGHHRMGIALECGLPKVAVRFSAAGQAPRFMHPLLRFIADISIRFKQRKS